MKQTISAVILTKNEAKNIRDCILSVQWCDEIIVVDDNSLDSTPIIATHMKAKLYVHPSKNNFAKQRNFALSKARGEWVLFVDADERVTPQLRKEIVQAISTSRVKGYYIQRLDTVWGKTLLHGETGNISLIRLAKKNSGRWVGPVHEVWKIKGTVVFLKNPLMHYPHQTVESFIEEIDYYTTIRANYLYRKRTVVSKNDIVLYPLGKFLVNYIQKKGFLDGVAGLIVALCMSFHSFLVRSKLYLLWQKS